MPDFSKRNITIDILRAVTMLLMIFVNDFWTVGEIPHCLEHGGTREDFLGLADFVFPCFLFAVGLSIPYAMEKRLEKGCTGLDTVFHILGRTFALIIMGAFFANTEAPMSGDMIIGKSLYRVLMIIGFILIWNVWPRDVPKLKGRLISGLRIAGAALLVFLMVIYKGSDDSPFASRGWGILGQIGWVYLLCSFLYLAFRTSIRKYAAIWVLCAILCIISAGNWLPRESFAYSLLKLLNIPPGAKPAYCLAGIMTTLASLRIAGSPGWKKILPCICVMAGLVLAGTASHNFWIVSKNLQTPPTMFYCTAASLAAYCLFSILADKGLTKWFAIIDSAGTATLTCYVMPIFLYSASRLIGLEPETGLSGAAGIAKCLLFSLVCIWLTGLLERLDIKLKL